jgi:hypothetical protein
MKIRKTSPEFDDSTASPEEYLAYLQRSCTGSKPAKHEIRFGQKKAGKRRIGSWEGYRMEYILHKFLKIDTRQAREMVSAMRDDMKELDFPTPFEDTLLYPVLHEIASTVREIAVDADLTIPEKIIFGTLPTGDFNAIMIKVPSGGIIVAINLGTFTFLDLMAETISSFITYNGKQGEELVFTFMPDQVMSSVRTNVDGNTRFVEVLYSQLVLGDAARSNFHPSNPNSRLANLWRDAAETFIVAHEYFHALIAHRDEHNTQKRVLDPIEVEEIPRSLIHELIADRCAIQITLAEFYLRRKMDLILAWTGIEFLFSLVEVIEQATGENSSTHPSASLRLRFMRDFMKKTYPDKHELIEFFDLIHTLILELWKRNQSSFRARCNERI